MNPCRTVRPRLFNFSNSYSELPERFYARLRPTSVAKPGLIKVNRKLAEELCLDPDMLESNAGVAVLAGNSIPDGAVPLAMVYAGHQFGGWVPQLGDGRAILLGEVIDQNGVRRDVQLKGSGPTPFSRMGDGRAWLGPVMREYLVSEAMHALGIPSTRSLAAVATGEPVQRERVYPGAVLTRVAKGHIRVGTFQYFLARNDIEALRLLADYTIARLHPDAFNSENPILGLLERVVDGQARLVAAWMGAGFIHGVMNTDNVSLACETIDFGPCAFMDNFHPHKVFSSIDHAGRYAFSNQPSVCHWNLAQFATTLLPILGLGKEDAIKVATDAVNQFEDRFTEAWLTVFRRKLGLAVNENNESLISGFLKLLAESEADFTVAFRRLTELTATGGKGDDAFVAYLGGNHAARDWVSAWRQRLGQDRRSASFRQRVMNSYNPALIPRNHLIEQAIDEAVAGNFQLFHDLDRAWTAPYSDHPQSDRFTLPPTQEEVVCRTFCGT